MSDEELPPSKLGTKAHWDGVYEREVKVFDDVGDEGEIWFGESSVTAMRAWAVQHLPATSIPIRILECGSGNGTLLLSFLTSPVHPRPFHLTGIDYSPGAITLARGVEASRRAALEKEEDQAVNPVEIDWRVGDLLRDEFGETWDLVLDKGTFDALALSSEKVEGRSASGLYPERVARLVKEGGFFLITSCNFTEEEVKERFSRSELGFTFHSSVPHPMFSFGGSSGTTVCTVAFQKGPTHSDGINGIRGTNGTSSKNGQNGKSKLNGHDEDIESLYICIDCGGTKTDAAIATASHGVIAQAIGGTGNMAEVGLRMSFEIIAATVLEAVSHLPLSYRKPHITNSDGLECPVSFADVWVGISGCDTTLDQQRMSDLLGPFFSRTSVPILNDAHLLGGALLTHHCPWGVAVIAGTGSVVVCLEVADNKEIVQVGRRGGLGYLLGDDGSAFDLGRSAIRCAVEDFDAGEEVTGELAQTIREEFGVAETGEILAKVHDLDPNLSPSDATNIRKLCISSLSRPILDAFTSSPPDPLAIRAVHQAATPLVDSIVSLVRQVERGSDKHVGDAALMMGGGVIRQEAYRRVIVDMLAEKGVGFGVEQVVQDVAGEGALGLVAKARAKAA